MEDFFKKYILVDKKPVVENNIFKWAEWIESADRAVARDTLEDGTTVSTVFLGIDHSIGGSKLLLFETCVFTGPPIGEWQIRESEVMDRYTTWEGAVGGHNRIVNKLKEKINEKANPPQTEEG